MKVSIQQPEFFPWTGFFNKIHQADLTVVLDSVQFKKRYFENRCRIVVDDQFQWLTVPVITKGRYHQTIFEVNINNDEDWGAKTYKKLIHTYGNAPYWDDHEPFLETVFKTRTWDRLVALNMEIIQYLCTCLNLSFNHVYASQIGSVETGSELILDLCQKVGATTYLSGAAGKDYLDEQAFKNAGINLVYQDFEQQAYTPFKGSYIGAASVFDALMSLGPDAAQLVFADAAPAVA